MSNNSTVKPQRWRLAAALTVALMLASAPVIYQNQELNKRVKSMTDPMNAPKFSRRVVYPVRMALSRIIIGFLGFWSTPANPYRKGYGYHTGLDYIGRDAGRGLGSSVLAIADGVVVDSSPTVSLFGYGNLVMIEHPQFGGLASRYAHLASRTVKKGDTVKAGQVVGTMGKSGTDNVHLHFDLSYKGKLATPRQFPRPGGWSKVAAQAAFRDPVEFFRSAGATDAPVTENDS
jgi:murein DD-endopeptidase MepM/ murein hydrolase activator NlpD